MNPQEKLLGFKKKIDKELASFFNFKISQVEEIDPKATFLVKQIKDLTMRGGKRLRPAFLYYGFRACGGEDERAVFPYCLAIELFHTMALIHDDIIDNSDLRRGGPAIHKVLGPSAAILAGDLCFSWAEEVFESKARGYSEFPIRVTRAARNWNLLKQEVILGQYLEAILTRGFSRTDRWLSNNFAKSEKEILKVMEYKTARYSVVRPLQIGARLAGAKKEELRVLENYGLPLGTAFQIIDDILGMFGKEETIGKPADSDLKEGKVTLLIVKTISNLKTRFPSEARKVAMSVASMSNVKSKTQILKLKRFLSLLGNKKGSKKDLEWVRGIIKETGALNHCQKKAKRLAEKAKRAIKDYPLEKEAKEFLLEIPNFIIKRKY